MKDITKFVHDSVGSAGFDCETDPSIMLGGLNTLIKRLEYIRQQVLDGQVDSLTANIKQVRDIRPQYIRSEQGEHTALHQVGPVVTQITVCDYTHADKVLDSQ